MTAVARLVSMFVRATRAQRVLEVGTGAGTTARLIAEALPPDGMLITVERDRDTAAAARQALAEAGQSHKVSVMIGDAAHYLHKLAGPFDLVLQDGDVAQYAALHDRLVELLAPSGTLITHNTAHAGDYNKVLAADLRLTTRALNVGEGVAVSVKSPASAD
jgi:caffeoyl-CoA O-methyltransferase